MNKILIFINICFPRSLNLTIKHSLLNRLETLLQVQNKTGTTVRLITIAYCKSQFAIHDLSNGTDVITT